MSDKITSCQQNSDGSFTFNFVLDNGGGVTITDSVTIAAAQAQNISAALPLALQQAANDKQTLFNNAALNSVVGPVILPSPNSQQVTL